MRSSDKVSNRAAVQQRQQHRPVRSLSPSAVSETAAASRQQIHGQTFQISFQDAYRAIAEFRNFRKLENLFIEADTDRSELMSLDEFRLALRKPWIRQSFSLLGVQPHQAEVVFKTMKKSRSKEVSIHDFVEGLEQLVGGDLDGPPRDLNVETLRPTYRARERLLLKGKASLLLPTPALAAPPPMSQPVAVHESSGSMDDSLTFGWELASQSFSLDSIGSKRNISDGEIFKHSASCKALHSATAPRC